MNPLKLTLFHATNAFMNQNLTCSPYTSHARSTDIQVHWFSKGRKSIRCVYRFLLYQLYHLTSPKARKSSPATIHSRPQARTCKDGPFKKNYIEPSQVNYTTATKATQDGAADVFIPRAAHSMVVGGDIYVPGDHESTWAELYNCCESNRPNRARGYQSSGKDGSIVYRSRQK